MSERPPPSPARPRRWWRHRRFARVPPLLHDQGRLAKRASRSTSRILLVNQYYWPDHASTAQHLTDLAEALAEQGHDVYVLCSRGSSRPGEARHKRFERHNGVTIHRVGATSLGRGSSLRRMCDYITFHARALIKAVSLPAFDVVVTLTTPPLIGLVGQVLRRLRGSRHLFWCMDLHPDASIALGRMKKNRIVTNLLAKFGDGLLRRADRVVALGPYMADRILGKGVRSQRVSIIPVWSRRDQVYPLPRHDHALRKRLGLEDKFVIMYSGNHGLAHSFDDLTEAARRLKHRDDLVFVFVGDGPRRREVVDAKARDGLSNVMLFDTFPREQLGESLSLADAHLVTLRPEMTGICVPSKLYGAMASGRPVIFIGPAHSEVADAIREAGCGFTLRPGNVEGLVAVIEQLADDAGLAQRLGEAGLGAFAAEFERESCCARWCWTIGELTGRPSQRFRIDSAELLPRPAALPEPEPEPARI